VHAKETFMLNRRLSFAGTFTLAGKAVAILASLISYSAALAIVGSIMVAGQYGAVGVALIASTGTVLQTILLWLTTRVRTGLWTHVSFRELFSIVREGW
jgi:hypothetical protein